MAVTKRRGRVGGLQVGFQTNYDTPIEAFANLVSKNVRIDREHHQSDP